MTDVHPDVALFLKQMRSQKRQTEKQEQRRVGKDAYEADPDHTILIRKGGRGALGKTITVIDCPACDFEFERTSVDIARTWAEEHNGKDHQNTLSIYDSTI